MGLLWPLAFQWQSEDGTNTVVVDVHLEMRQFPSVSRTGSHPRKPGCYWWQWSAFVFYVLDSFFALLDLSLRLQKVEGPQAQHQRELTSDVGLVYLPPSGACPQRIRNLLVWISARSYIQGALGVEFLAELLHETYRWVAPLWQVVINQILIDTRSGRNGGHAFRGVMTVTPNLTSRGYAVLTGKASELGFSLTQIADLGAG